MSRRTIASLLSVGMLVVLLVWAAQLPVPYVTLSPGPTVDVLGEVDGTQIVQVDGEPTYPTDGELRLTTVSVTRPDAELSLVAAIESWLRDDVAVVPYAAMYPEESSNEEEEAESAAQMVSSQDTAVAAALTQLGYELDTHPEVVGVDPGGPSKGKLKARDVITSVDGTATPSVEAVLAALEDVEPDERVALDVRRQGEHRTVNVVTAESPDDPERAILGVTVGTGYELPFDVRLALEESIGGPSAGLMFALSVYDELTPGALTGGHDVAGTGTITLDGSVGPIGGIRQKIAGAKDSGAELFLVPPANCAGAVAEPIHGIELVRADTLRSAVGSLQKYAENQSADLPRCPS